MRSLAITTLATGLLGAGPASAALLVNESFNYAAGAVSGASATGAGLSGSWFAGATGGGASGATLSFQAASLSFSGHFASSGGSLNIANPSGPYAETAASATISAALTGYSTLYSSSVMTMATAGTYFNDWVVEQRFNSSQNGSFGSSSGRNQVSSFNSGGAAARKAGVSADSSEAREATGTLAAGTNYLLVTKYTVSGGNITNATLYVFDQAAYGGYLSAATAGTADSLLGTHALVTLGDSGTAAVGSVGYLQFAINGGPNGTFDDYRLGSEITDVVNVAAAIPEPSAAAVLAGASVLGLAVLRRRKRK